jgi:hypothetical protein
MFCRFVLQLVTTKRGDVQEPVLDYRSPPPNAKGVSWRELSVTADFGRTTGPFIMRAFDSDSDEDSDEEESKSAPLVENKSSAR